MHHSPSLAPSPTPWIDSACDADKLNFVRLNMSFIKMCNSSRRMHLQYIPIQAIGIVLANIHPTYVRRLPSEKDRR